jgi:pectate lyase
MTLKPSPSRAAAGAASTCTLPAWVSMLTAFVMSAGALGAAPDSIPVSFTVDEPSYVTLVIEDASGRRVRNLVSGEFFPAGTHTVPWDGHDESKPLEWDSSIPPDGDYPKDADGVYRDHGVPVQPGAYSVRGIVRPRIRLNYEMTAYNMTAKSQPVIPWNRSSNIGGWLADHTAPSCVLYVPRGRVRFDAGTTLDPTTPYSEIPSLLFGSYGAEGGLGLIMTDTEGKKYAGFGGFTAYVSPGLMARDPRHEAGEIDNNYTHALPVSKAVQNDADYYNTAKNPDYTDPYYAYAVAITRSTLDEKTGQQQGRLQLIGLVRHANVSRERFVELWARDGIALPVPGQVAGETFSTGAETFDVVPGLTIYDGIAAMSVAPPTLGNDEKHILLINVTTGWRPFLDLNRYNAMRDPSQLGINPVQPDAMSFVIGKISFSDIGAEVRGLAFDKEGRLLVLTPTGVKRYIVNRDKVEDNIPTESAEGWRAGSTPPVRNGVVTEASLKFDTWLIAEGQLDDARYIMCDYLPGGGDIYIAQHGNSHQVKRYTAEGGWVRDFGNAAPLGTGVYDPSHMNNPTGLAVTPEGELWVTEHNFMPKRVSVWNIETGALVKDVLGPPDYGGGGVLDPEDRTKFYLADYHEGMMELKLDWEKGTSEVSRVLWRPKPTDPLIVPRRNITTDAGNFAVPLTPIRFGGRTYFHNTFYESATTAPVIGGLWLLDEERGEVKFVALVGNPYKWPRLRNESKWTGDLKAKWPADFDWSKRDDANYQTNNPMLFTWSDLDGDGDMSLDEVGFARIPDSKRFGGMTLDIIDGKLTFIQSYNWSVAHSGVTAGGAPIFKAEDTKLFMVDIPPLNTTENEKFISYGKTGFDTFYTPEGYMVMTGCPIQGFKKNADGKGGRVWTYPNTWSSLHQGHLAPNPPQYPGQLIATMRSIAPPFQVGEMEKGGAGSMWAYNCDRGSLYLFTADGLYIDTLFSLEARSVNWADLPAMERGFDLTDISVPGENFWPSITKADDGNVYITTGKTHTSLVKVNGLEQIKRVNWGVLQLKAGDIPQSQTYEPSGESDTLSVTIRPKEDTPTPPNPPSLKVDGNLDEWAAMDWVRIESQTYAAIATDGDRLYLAYQSYDGALGRNSAESYTNLFKTGGAFDLLLRTSATAAVTGTRSDLADMKPVVDGDTRVTIALGTTDGQPVATLYRQVDKTATAQDGFLFSSPVGEIHFARVEEINDRIAFAQGAPAPAIGNVFPTLAEPPELHAYEMSIDLATVGIELEQGRNIRGDIGLIIGDNTTSTARFYWKSKMNGLTNDLAGEATLTPINWGVLEVKGPAPVVEKDPVSQIVAAGERVVISAGVSGWQPMTCLWEKSTAADGDYATVASVTGDASYIIPAAAESDTGWYRVKVENGYGSQTSEPAELVVRPAAFPPPAPDGYGAGTTGGGGTGGDGGAPTPSVLVSTFEELRARAESEDPLVINIRGNIILTEPVYIKSNKTIQGIDENATISGGLVLGGGVDNVIIRGLAISNPAAGGIGVDIDGANNVFITHCALFDCAGGCVRVTNASENVTVSWSKFYYTSTPGGPAMLAGTAGDAYPPHVTLHHNTWENIASGMPLAVASWVHMYNNYFAASSSAASSVAGAGAEILSEYNTYDSIKTPLMVVQNAANAGIRAVSNVYIDSDSTWNENAETVGGGIVFSPDYTYTLQLASEAVEAVTDHAGDTKGADSTAPASAVTLRIEGADGVFAYGTPFVFTSTITGGEAKSYQWRRDNFDLPDATGPFYAEDAASASSSGVYVLQARLSDPDGGGLAVSNPKFIVTGQAPLITRQPDSSLHSPIYPPLKEVSGAEGKDVSLYVIAIGEPALRYQWQKQNGAGYQDVVGVAGAANHTLTLNRVSSGDAGAYRVIVTNEFGSGTSSAITLAGSPAGNATGGGGGGGGGAYSLAGLGLGLALVLLATRRRAARRP